MIIRWLGSKRETSADIRLTIRKKLEKKLEALSTSDLKNKSTIEEVLACLEASAHLPARISTRNKSLQFLAMAAIFIVLVFLSMLPVSRTTAEIALTVRKCDLVIGANEAALARLAMGNASILSSTTMQCTMASAPVNECQWATFSNRTQDATASIVIEPVLIQAGTSLGVHYNGERRETGVTLKPGPEFVHLFVAGPAAAQFGDHDPIEVESGGIRQISILGGQSELEMRWTASPRITLARALAIKSIRCEEDFKYIDESTSEEWTSSSVIAGRVRWKDVPGKETELHEGADVSFEFENARLLYLRVIDDAIELAVSGQASRITASRDPQGPSLMPTWLEWLLAREKPKLLVGLTAYLFGLMVTAIRWIRG